MTENCSRIKNCTYTPAEAKMSVIHTVNTIQWTTDVTLSNKSSLAKRMIHILRILAPTLNHTL